MWLLINVDGRGGETGCCGDTDPFYKIYSGTVIAKFSSEQKGNEYIESLKHSSNPADWYDQDHLLLIEVLDSIQTDPPNFEEPPEKPRKSKTKKQKI